MKMLSLYSGVGGLDLAATWAGIEVVAHCESNAFCRSVLTRHWPEVPCYESDEHVSAESLRARGVDPGSIDIVAGGPPCQPFSVAGKQGGVSDPRHRWPEMARIVSEIRPAWVVVENVAQFANLALDAVLADLDSLGYTSRTFAVPAAGVGAPHKRERVFVLAYSGHDRREQRSARNNDGGSDAQRDDARGRDAATLADANGAGLSEQRAPGRGERQERQAPQSRLGRATNVVAGRLDATRWPAARGVEQFVFEAPRLTTDRTRRRARLEALGNAVVPAQAFPVFALIAEVSE